MWLKLLTTLIDVVETDLKTVEMLLEEKGTAATTNLFQ